MLRACEALQAIDYTQVSMPDGVRTCDSSRLRVSTYFNLKVVAFLYSRMARVAFRGGHFTTPRHIQSGITLRISGHRVK